MEFRLPPGPQYGNQFPRPGRIEHSGHFPENGQFSSISYQTEIWLPFSLLKNVLATSIGVWDIRSSRPFPVPILSLGGAMS